MRLHKFLLGGNVRTAQCILDMKHVVRLACLLADHIRIGGEQRRYFQPERPHELRDHGRPLNNVGALQWNGLVTTRFHARIPVGRITSGP